MQKLQNSNMVKKCGECDNYDCGKCTKIVSGDGFKLVGYWEIDKDCPLPDVVTVEACDISYGFQHENWKTKTAKDQLVLELEENIDIEDIEQVLIVKKSSHGKE